MLPQLTINRQDNTVTLGESVYTLVFTTMGRGRMRLTYSDFNLLYGDMFIFDEAGTEACLSLFKNSDHDTLEVEVL